MRRIVSIVLLGTGCLFASAANAQSWGVYIGGGNGYSGQYADPDGDDGLVNHICSGQRARGLEARLRQEVDEEEIGDDDADQIHGAIDRLEDRERHECAEGDRRAIYEIARRYDRIGEWIDAEAHGFRRRGW